MEGIVLIAQVIVLLKNIRDFARDIDTWIGDSLPY